MTYLEIDRSDVPVVALVLSGIIRRNSRNFEVLQLQLGGQGAYTEQKKRNTRHLISDLIFRKYLTEDG